MPSIVPLDPKICMQHYNHLLKCICNPPTESESTGCSTPEPSSSSTPTPYEPDLDEDSKMSIATTSSTCSLDEVKPFLMGRRGRGRGSSTQGERSGKNPRKSPRQHASTLAILSSFIHQRKRRSRNRNFEESLPTIPEEDNPLPEEAQKLPPQIVQKKPKSPHRDRRFKPKIDYFSIARQIDDELDTALDDDNLDELDIGGENTVDFCSSKIDIKDILRLYEENKSKEDEKSCKRFFTSTPGRKPGRRRKKNKTGWPNKNRRLVRKGQDKEKEEDNDNDDSTIDSLSVNLDSDDEDSNSTDSIKKVTVNSESKVDDAVSSANCDVDRVEKRDKVATPPDKVLTNKVTNNRNLQPYVCVQKLDSAKLMGKQRGGSAKRTQGRQRRVPGSPKSPRMLRRPRGRWYRER